MRKSIETGTSITKIGEAYGFEDTMKLIVRLIQNTERFFNVKNKLDEFQLVQITQTIIERWGHDNIEDIILALKNARMGFVDQIYGRIDGEVVMQWISTYMEQKAYEIERLHQEKKNQENSELSKLFINNSDALSKLKDVVNKKNTHQSPVNTNFSQTFEDFIADFLKPENIKKYTTQQLITAKNDFFNTSVLLNTESSKNLYNQIIEFINTEIESRIDDICDVIATKIEGKPLNFINNIKKKYTDNNTNGVYDPVIEVIDIEIKSRRKI